MSVRARVYPGAAVLPGTRWPGGNLALGGGNRRQAHVCPPTHSPGEVAELWLMAVAWKATVGAGSLYREFESLLLRWYAEVAQLAERLLPKQEVRGFEARLPLRLKETTWCR